jgi:hypothetical protein
MPRRPLRRNPYQSFGLQTGNWLKKLLSSIHVEENRDQNDHTIKESSQPIEKKILEDEIYLRYGLYIFLWGDKMLPVQKRI